MQWLWKALVFGLASPIAASTALAERGDVTADGARMGAQVIHNYRTVDPVRPMDLATYEPYQCPEPGIIAFSVSGANHVSEGAATLLGYSSTFTNEGGGWTNGGGTFAAPCAGLYFFTVSFVKDAFQYGGTKNDVFVYIYQNGVVKGFAWSGQSNDTDRTVGTYSVSLVLEKGDYVQTFVSSASGVKRHLIKFDFTGHMVRQRY